MVSAAELTESLTSRDLQREETRRRVRDCALQIFRRDGVAAAKIEEIVKLAGVSRGTFYFHFPTKEDVIVDLLDEAEGRVAHAIEVLPTSTPLKKVLDAMCTQMAHEWESERELFPQIGAVALGRGAATFQPESLGPVRTAIAASFRAAKQRRELTASMPAEVLADFFLINVFAAALAWCAHPRHPLREVLRSVVDIFLNGARGPRR